MKRFITTCFALAALTTILSVDSAEAQVTASSYSTGGTAISTAYGRGNTRLNSSAFASGGGYARSNISGSGINGGFASGNSRAISHGGVAISGSHSHANGWGARSHSDSFARTVGGFAQSDSTAIARGNWADANSSSGVDTWGTYGRSSSEAIDNRFGSGYQTLPAPPQYGVPTTTSNTGVSSGVFQSSTPRGSVIRGFFRRGR